MGAPRRIESIPNNASHRSKHRRIGRAVNYPPLALLSLLFAIALVASPNVWCQDANKLKSAQRVRSLPLEKCVWRERGKPAMSSLLAASREKTQFRSIYYFRYRPFGVANTNSAVVVCFVV